MDESKTNKRIFFNENWDTYYRLRNIGYHDFHIIKPTKFARIYNWTSLHFVASGKGTLIMRDKTYKLCSGDFFYIPANEPATYYSDDTDPWSYYWISFAITSSFPYAKKLRLNANSPKRPAKNPEKITALFDELFSLETSPSSFCYMTLSALMQILAYESSHPASPVPRPVSHKEVVSTVKQIIKLNYSNPGFSIKEIAPVLYLSTRQIDRIFKAETQQTPRAYLVHTRLSHAAELLHQSDYKIKELCNLTGFYDEFQFMKLFKAKYKMTVKEYRSAHK